MQLNLETDYAIRCMLYLAATGKCANAQEIGDAAAISKNHAQKILRSLHLAGFVTVTHGSAGGFAIAKPACQVSLLDILCAMEKTTKINRCMEEDAFCSRNGTSPEVNCPVHRFYEHAQKTIDDMFGSTTLADLLEENYDPATCLHCLSECSKHSK